MPVRWVRNCKMGQDEMRVTEGVKRVCNSGRSPGEGRGGERGTERKRGSAGVTPDTSFSCNASNSKSNQVDKGRRGSQGPQSSLWPHGQATPHLPTGIHAVNILELKG